jgi:hypothetical protein
MDIDFSVEVARLRWHHAALRFELSMLRHAQALRKKYDPNQPRVPAGEPGGGQWTSEESSEIDFSAARRVSPSRTAECEMQFRRDTFHCNMVGLPACYAQAMLRYSNCLSGLPIPPLSY